jgi:hypothetical protein
MQYPAIVLKTMNAFQRFSAGRLHVPLPFKGIR